MNIKRLLLSLILLAPLNNSCSFHPNEIYLIPKGYTGDVIIFFDQPDGVTPEMENGSYVYKIPADGILKVKTQGGVGIFTKSFYYVDENNQREKLKTLRVTGDRSPTGEPQNKFGNITQDQYEHTVYVMAVGGLGSFNTKKGIIQFTSFIIGTPKDSDQLYMKMERRTTDMQRKFLQES